MKYKHSFVFSLILILATLTTYFFLDGTEIISNKIYLGVGISIIQAALYILLIGFFTKAIKISDPYHGPWVFLALVSFFCRHCYAVCKRHSLIYRNAGLKRLFLASEGLGWILVSLCFTGKDNCLSLQKTKRKVLKLRFFTR